MSNEKNAQAELERIKAEKAELEKQLAEANAAKEEARAQAEAAEAKAREHSERVNAEVARQERKIIEQLRRQRKARIVIPSGRDAHERCPVCVGINGREYLIERDREVDVPVGVLAVLDLAVAKVAERVSFNEEGMGQSIGFTTARRINYTLLGYIDPKTGNLETP